MENQKNLKIKTLSEYHRLRGLPKPSHPLISVIEMESLGFFAEKNLTGLVLDFYSVCIKRSSNLKLKYGQHKYDFDSGVMFFMSPNQIFSIYANGNETPAQSGVFIAFSSRLFVEHIPCEKHKKNEFFNYSVNEALFLSDKEEATINNIVQSIQQEYHSNIDKFSKQIIISHMETLLNYSERFYNRQFITREKAAHQVLDSLEEILTDYFDSDNLISKGLPTVQYISEALNVSAKYLGNMLKVLTGQNAQQHIHQKLIEKAKERLSTTDLTISEIVYESRFKHLQSFSKLFKAKTNLTPLDFRRSFN